MLSCEETVLLQIRPFRETGYLLKGFSKDKGIISFLIQGVRGKSKRKSNFHLFAPYEFVYYDSNKSELKRIKEHAYLGGSFEHNPMRDFIATFCAEVFIEAVKEEELSMELFELLHNASLSLSQATELSEFHFGFIRQLISISGIAPQAIRKDDSQAFDLLEANFVDPKHQIDLRNLLDLEESRLFEGFINNKRPFAKNGEERFILLDLILRFLEIQLPGFRRPKSVEVLHAVLHD